MIISKSESFVIDFALNETNFLIISADRVYQKLPRQFFIIID